MELKFGRKSFASYLLSYNRTFMELKLIKDIELLFQCSYNRTFMELKFGKFNRNILVNYVIIVPLWN